MTILRYLLALLFIIGASNCSIAMDEDMAMDIDLNVGSCARTRQYQASRSELISLFENACKVLSLPCNRIEIIWGRLNLRGQLNTFDAENAIDEDYFSESSSGNIFYGGESDFYKIIPEFRRATLQLSWLRELDLSGNNLKNIPNGIERLVRLEVLDLSGNNLEQISNGIESLERLQILNLSNNNLKAIPYEIGDLKNLIELNVSYNLISWLPASLIKLSKLRNLYANDNNLWDIAVISCLVSLTSLDLSDNRIKILPIMLGCLKLLEELYLHNNPLLEVPDTLGDLVSIQDMVLPILSDTTQRRSHWGMAELRARFKSKVLFVHEAATLSPENFLH